MVRTGAFARLTALPHQDGKEVQIMARGLDHVVGNAPNAVPGHHQELHEQGRRVTLGVRRYRPHDLPRESVVGLCSELWPWCWRKKRKKRIIPLGGHNV